VTSGREVRIDPRDGAGPMVRSAQQIHQPGSRLANGEGAVSDHTSESGVVQRIIAGLHRIDEWWYAADDARARRHGWDVRETAGGLGRSYRDPRFGWGNGWGER